MVGLATALPLLRVPAAAAHDSPACALGTVTGVAASEDQEAPGSITISWNAATPGAAPITDSIVVVMNVNDETDYRTVPVTTSGPNPSPGELESRITGLKSRETYEVSVRARNLVTLPRGAQPRSLDHHRRRC